MSEQDYFSSGEDKAITAVLPLEETEEPGALLESLYGFLSHPEQFESFFNRLDDQLIQLSNEKQLGGNNGSSHVNDPDWSLVEYHFTCAAKIFDRIGLQTNSSAETSKSSDHASPKWAFGKDGRLITQNKQAQQFGDLLPGAHFSHLNADPLFNAICTEELAARFDGTRPELKVFVMSEGEGAESQQLFFIVRSDDETDAPCLQVSHCRLDWRDQIGALLEQSFGLSGTEQDILRGVVEGKSLNEIAIERNRSVETIRTQSKSLLRKTGAKSQVGLVRLFAAMRLSMPEPQEAPPSESNGRSHLLRTSFFQMSADQTLQIDEYGSKVGFPVILLHGLFSGTGLTDKAAAYIAQSGLRVLAPWRPGFAQSNGMANDYTQAPEAFAVMIERIMDQYGFRKAALVGRFTGCIYAAAAAQMLGNRVSSTILLSPTQPITHHDQLRSMKGWQRVFAYAITYAPAVVPILVRGMRQFLFRKQVDKFMDGFYASPPSDRKHCVDVEIQRLIETQVDQTFAQGTKAHELDLMLTGSDWSRYLRNIASPVMVMHGSLNPVDPLHGAEHLANLANAESFLVLPDAGQLFVHAEPELVWGHIARFMRTGGNARKS